MAASYRVVAPYVTLKVKDAAGADVLVGFYEGAIVSDVEEESLKHHLDGEMLEKLPAAEAKKAAGE
jgi:hypothetical protein